MRLWRFVSRLVPECFKRDAVQCPFCGGIQNIHFDRSSFTCGKVPGLSHLMDIIQIVFDKE